MRRAFVPALLAFTVNLEAAQPAKLYELAGRLFSPDPAVRAEARDRLIQNGDPSIAAALVDSLFFNTHGRAETAAALEGLLGEKHGLSFKKWIEVIGRREDLSAAPGYIEFKANLFRRIDPQLATLLRPNAPRTIRPEEIVWGGVKKDGIPALERPRLIEAADASWLQPDEPVFGVIINGDARAYPERILAWHEMANDVVGDRPVTLSYCTLCGAAILYDGRASDGRTYTFGSSGFLYRSNKLMYDRQTQTLWSQLTGLPVLGELAGKRLEPLRMLPITVTRWRDWVAAHPRTHVLSLETGYKRDYRPGAAYGAYFASEETMFPVWKKASSPSLRAKEWVLVVPVGALRKIYPLEDLQQAGLVHDRVAGEDLVLVGEKVYASGGRRFRRDGDLLIDESGAAFRITEEALLSASGAPLLRLPAHRAFWFGAYAFYPGSEVWKPAGSSP